MIEKVYGITAVMLLLIDFAIPHPCHANLHRGSIYANTCGSQPAGQMWCVSASTGYTVFTASPKTNSGTACANSSSTTNETCIVAVAAAGNDTTCQAQSAPTNNYLSTSLSSFSPSLPCATLSKAQTLLRNNSADWMVLNRGDTWVGGINGSSGDTWNNSGLSANQPMLVASYGTGARPLISQSNSNDLRCWQTISTHGQYMAFVGLHCDKAVHDPNSASFQGATITADTTSGTATLSNINGGSGLPSQFFTTASYSLNGNGINNLTPTASVGAGTTSLTMNGNASFTATQMKIQIQDRQANSGINMNGITNFLIIEDCEFDYGGNSFATGTGNVNPANPSSYPTINWYFRRNVFNSSTLGGANLFLASNCPANYGCAGGQITIEENLSNYGAWDPSIWAYAGNSQDHTWYLHDPSVPVYIHGNVVGNNSSDNQYRDGGTAINNLFWRNSNAFAAALEDNQTSISYNVVEAGSDNTIGIRTATAIATSGTVLSIPGASNLVGNNLEDVNNPGAIPTTAAISSVRDGFSVNLSVAITAGIRGNGVQIGDTIRVVSSNGNGIQTNAIGLYLDPGPATGGIYPAGSTVSVSAATPAIVTETGATSARSQDEPFQFTAGTLPTGLSLNTTYCADPANGSSTAYPVYAATGGACSGGTDIATSGSPGSGITRTGSRKFTFSISESNLPVQTIPSWVTVGMSVFNANNAPVAFPQTISGLAGGTTVASISADRKTLITSDASIAAVPGSNPVGDGQQAFLFNVPNNPNYPTSRLGPNNVFINRLAGSFTGDRSAIAWNPTTSGNDGSQNYIYNWSQSSTANNTADNGFPGTNLPALASSQILNSGTKAVPDTRFPLANIEAYDAAVNGSGFNGTVTGAATFNPGAGSTYDGGTLTVNSGTAPAIGDMIFCTGCTQYMTVVSGSAPTFTVSAPPGTMVNVGPIAMVNGSFAHFISQGLLQNAQTGWKSQWTAAAANNYIRQQIQCGNQTTFPGSPICQQLN